MQSLSKSTDSLNSFLFPRRARSHTASDLHERRARKCLVQLLVWSLNFLPVFCQCPVMSLHYISSAHAYCKNFQLRMRTLTHSGAQSRIRLMMALTPKRLFLSLCISISLLRSYTFFSRSPLARTWQKFWSIFCEVWSLAAQVECEGLTPTRNEFEESRRGNPLL